MTRTIVIKGRVVGPRTVELDKPLPAQTSEVQVLAHIKTSCRKLSEIIRSFPSGTRTKEDIDRQINQERDSWD